MIVVTGAAGFIGSALVAKLNELGKEDLILVDDFSNIDKNRNLDGKQYSKRIDRFEFIKNPSIYGEIDIIYHLGARTDTTEFDKEIFDVLNVEYSKKIWEYCTKNRIPLVYASSAATYGDGSHGFDDDMSQIPSLEPLNPYGASKQEFDMWVLEQTETPPHWAGLKFFNVFGPNEYHKGRMASVVLHAYRQIMETGRMKLFASHHPDYPDGGQKRDFIYVKDVIDLVLFWGEKEDVSGIFNVGTGKARTFLDLVNSVFHALGMEPKIEFIPTPEDIRDKYQYFTEAKMNRTRNAGYSQEFQKLEDAIDDYVNRYLKTSSYW